METKKPEPKKTRTKRRVPGSDTPPRVSIALRMEQQDLDQMTAMLKNSKLSRNDFICGLITAELAHIERFRLLKTDPAAPHYVERRTARRSKAERRNTES